MIDFEALGALSSRLDGFWGSQCLHVAAALGLADQIDDTPVPTHDLAARVGAQEGPLRRLLRALAAVDVFAPAPSEHRDAWVHSAQSRLLREDSPSQLRARCLSLGQLAWASWGQLEHAVRTGQPAFDRVHGVPFFEYLARNPKLGATFGRTMTSFTQLTANAVSAAHDFSGYRHLIDIGGGDGVMAAALLREYPDLRVTILDRHEVIVRGAPAVPKSVRHRLELAAGDFFDPQSIPVGADAHLLSWVLHDWDGADGQRILDACSQRLAPTGEVIVVEMVTGNDAPPFPRFFDLEMLVQTGGRERTRLEFEELFGSVDLRLCEVAPTQAPQSVLIARRRDD